jgi:anti-sigma B factor antagonist
MTAEATFVYVDHVVRLICVRTRSCDDWRAAIELCGELDCGNADELRSELDRHLAAGRRVIRVDTSRLEFMDSTAMGVLVTASEECRRQHGSLILTGVRRPLRRLLGIAGLDEVLLVDTAHAS